MRPMNNDTDIRKLTVEILTLSDTLERDRAESVVEIGAKMTAVRSALRRGAWGAWLEDLPYTKQSAQNYMQLATWAATEPGLFVRFKSLGPSKLYALLRLPPKTLGALPDPGSAGEPQLERMAAHQVHALVRELRGEVAQAQPVAKLLQSGTQRMRGVLEVVDELVGRRDELESDAMAGLQRQLEDALRRVVG